VRRRSSRTGCTLTTRRPPGRCPTDLPGVRTRRTRSRGCPLRGSAVRFPRSVRRAAVASEGEAAIPAPLLHSGRSRSPVLYEGGLLPRQRAGIGRLDWEWEASGVSCDECVTDVTRSLARGGPRAVPARKLLVCKLLTEM